MLNIIRKEILEHIQSIQFAVLLGASILLFLVNGLTFSGRYRQEMLWYSESVTAAQQRPSTVFTNLFVEPSPVLFVCEGGTEYRPAQYMLQPGGVITPSAREARNYKMPEFPQMDWAFIIKILFSLYVVLLGYDTISGEKEQGTLRLMFSHSIGRLRLLLAKYAAIIVTAMLPLLVGLLTSLVIMGFTIPSVLSAAVLSRIGLFVVLAFMYLSIFALSSILISAVIHQSSLGLLTLLVVWVCFAIIVPNTSGILADKFTSVPSEFETAKQVGPMIQQQVWARIGKIRQRVDRGELTTEEDVHREADDAYARGQQDLVKHYEAYSAAMNRRAALARDLSRISPTALFAYASEGVAGTGTEREQRFLRAAREYSRVYDGYIVKKVGKLVPVSRFSFLTNMEIGGKNVMVGSPRPQEYTGDKSDFPQFEEPHASAGEDVQGAMVDLLGLVVWNIVLAALAFGVIMRMDVR